MKEDKGEGQRSDCWDESEDTLCIQQTRPCSIFSDMRTVGVVCLENIKHEEEKERKTKEIREMKEERLGRKFDLGKDGERVVGC